MSLRVVAAVLACSVPLVAQVTIYPCEPGVITYENPDPHPANDCNATFTPPSTCTDPVPDPAAVTLCKTDDHFGAHFATDGDWNGDGVNDLAIAGLNQITNPVARGEVWLYLGNSTTPALRFTGSSAAGQFGYALSFVKDMNGDGRDELLVSAPRWAPPGAPGASVGRVYLIPGQPDGSYTPGEDRLGEEWAGAIFQGDVVGGRFGESIEIARIDSGLSRDVLIGSPGSALSDSAPPPWSPNGYAARCTCSPAAARG